MSLPMTDGRGGRGPGRADLAARRRAGPALLLFLAFLACLSVYALNGRPLFYGDTTYYLAQGDAVLSILGLGERDDYAAARAAADGGAAVAPAESDTVDGARSAAFSLLIGSFAQAGMLGGLVLLNAACVVLAVWLVARVALRSLAPHVAPTTATLLAVAAGALGSLPFYVAFLMADIMAPVLILAVATLAAFAPRMGWGELALAFGLGAVAVTTHLSHLGIILLLLPVVVVAALLLPGPRRWLAPALVAGMAAVAFAEQGALRVAADAAGSGEVVYSPFLVARLIEDGPGLDYLERHCPDAAIPACVLHEALARSDDPRRLRAASIGFQRTPGVGSFLLLPSEDQRDIAAGQVDFFLDVLRERPLATVGAFLENSLQQAALTSVDMTLQTDEMVDHAAAHRALGVSAIDHGRLTERTGWVDAADTLHAALYIVSTLALVVAMLLPRTPAPLRTFLALVLLGILANAFVCGGVSTPASRYGARVAWLLPVAAVLAGAVLLGSRGARGGAASMPATAGRANG